MKRSVRDSRMACAAATFVAAVGMAGALEAEDLFADVTSGQSDVVTIEGGQLQGYSSGRVATFFGIPFAAPPLGDLRWMPPADPEPWEGVRDAGAFGGSCVQTTTYGVFATPSTNEDCLFLNVFAPPADEREELRPVMIWIHGGGLVNGRADDFDGRKLVTEGDVVVVTINYRLNLFGYFAHPAISDEGNPFGNYGTMDQQAAMRWVQRNIEAFGGDPGNVTLFGESAGGLATLFNMVSPPAEGLFHKAILQSGVSASPQTPLDQALEYGVMVAEALGCTDAATAAECMRSKTVDEIIAAGAFTGRSTRVVDGTILPGQLQELMAEGAFHRVPILIGNNLDEWTWFISFAELDSGQPMTEEDYFEAYVATYGEEAAERIEAEYPLEDFPSPSEAAAAAGTARNFVCPSRRVMASAAEHVPVYVYEFMDTEAPIYFPEVSFPYGAAHTLEIQYIFPRYHGAAGVPRPLDAAQQELSDAMVAYWTNFARTGDPNGEGLPEWPQWRPEAPQTQLLDAPDIATAADSGVDRKCEFWDAL